MAFYSDKHAVFRVSQAETRRTGITQFGRALHNLNIELICANSSQAKGRVERANLTLQVQLVKEMRLETLPALVRQVGVLKSGGIVDNKRLGAVLKLEQEIQDELEAAGKRKRSREMSKRRAQVQE